MRRSVQPNWPRAMTCRFFASLKMFAMPAEGRTPPPPRQRLERLLPMAGFQLSIYGGFWVSTEGILVVNEDVLGARRRLYTVAATKKGSRSAASGLYFFC